MWFYYFIFFFIAGCYFVTIDTPFKKKVFWFLAILLICIAGFRGAGIDNDYSIYQLDYNVFKTISFTQLEPSFYIISYWIHASFNNILFLFLFYSILGVSLKFYAIKKLSHQYFLCVITYFSYFFLLHEMTQIRVGVASGIMMLSIPDIYNRNIKSFTLKNALAILFHYSASVFLFFYFIDTKKINVKVYVGLILSAYLLHFAHIRLINLLTFLPIETFVSKIDTYQKLASIKIHSDIDIFNIVFLFRVVVCIILLLNINTLAAENKYAIILLKIYTASIFCFVALSDLPVLAGRVNQLLGVVEIIIFPFFAYLFKPKVFGVASVVLIALGMISIKLLYGQLVKGYF